MRHMESMGFYFSEGVSELTRSINGLKLPNINPWGGMSLEHRHSKYGRTSTISCLTYSRRNPICMSGTERFSEGLTDTRIPKECVGSHSSGIGHLRTCTTTTRPVVLDLSSQSVLDGVRRRRVTTTVSRCVSQRIVVTRRPLEQTRVAESTDGNPKTIHRIT